MADYDFLIGSYFPKPTAQTKILTEQRFGKLLVIGFAGRHNKRLYWHCLCDCGNGISVAQNHLPNGHTQSCGCLFTEMIQTLNQSHGETKNGQVTPELRAFSGAKDRCTNPNNISWRHYGGRGIEFRLPSIEHLIADIGRRPTDKHSLDRIDVHGHYEVGNLRWATPREQAQNKRNTRLLTAFNKTQCLYEWSRKFNVPPNCILSRLNVRWCIECAVSLPVGRRMSCSHKISTRLHKLRHRPNYQSLRFSE